MNEEKTLERMMLAMVGASNPENEEADAYDIEIPSWKWRQPTIDEIKALQMRAIWRTERYRVPPMEAPRDWVHVGALV